MAISTQGTVLKITTIGQGDTAGTAVATVDIKSFPDLGAAPAAIDVTTLSDSVQKFIPGVKALAAMEFVANYDKTLFETLQDKEGETLKYSVEFGADGANGKFEVEGTHALAIAGAGLNAAVDMKITVLPNGEITVA